MTRYFFHLRGSNEVAVDEEGLELPDLDAARAVALHGARDTLSHEMRSGCIDLRVRIDVEDEEGRALHSQAFADAFEVIRKDQAGLGS